ncbi:MAG TPA: multicopper oxidase family protein [Rhodothermia bacterium]|nr:multicopper oxidase family protein [Rhodothermia bacterium]
MSLSLRYLTFSCLLLSAGDALGQGHEGHAMHHHPPDDSAEVTWRMPPMDPSMPMMPGIEKEVPVVAPFLPAASMAKSALPKAVDRAIVELADGDTLRMEAAMVTKTIAGKTLTMYGYNGQIPGPLIRVDQASKIFVQFLNNIELPTTVHWHGLRLDNRFDGVPGVTQAPVNSGETFLYELTFPDAGLYWYHPHIREDIQQDLGLYGNMLVDAIEADYYSPANREEVLVLDDILIDALGPIPYGKEAPTHTLMGRFGNVMLVNGDPSHSMQFRTGDVVRFFLTNVANARTFNVTFGGYPVKVVGSDVSRFEREEWVESIPIGPAERYVVEVWFDRPGEVAMTNSIMAINHFMGEFYPHVDTLSVIQVLDAPSDTDYSTSFQTLREHTAVVEDIDAFRPLFDKPVDVDLELGLRVQGLPVTIMLAMEIDTLYVPPMEWNDAMPEMNWLATGEQVEWIIRDLESGAENMGINWTFSLGDVVKMRIFNDPRTLHPMNHPIHIHGQRFLVLELDGIANRNMVWKDTAIVPVGSTMEILVEMSNPGTWMMHCHIAEHLHAGMMLSFTVSDDSTN